MIARCIVETGTSSYYTALHEAAAEPVLQEICRRIAADELRHYRLFYKTLCAYQARERLGRWARLQDRARPPAPRARMTSSPMPITPPMRRRSPMTDDAYSRAYAARAARFTAPTMSSAWCRWC